MVRKLLLIIPLVFFMIQDSHGQKVQNEVPENGYATFYYPNGVVSSEGPMRNGKPDGFWKTYYVTGVKKSEGKRTNHLLDSVWVFYDQVGDTLEKITYLLGKKNGYYWKYGKKQGTGELFIEKRELFVNDERAGTSYTYFPEAKVKLAVPYANGRRDGLAREYDRDSTVIALYEYRRGVLVNREQINRYNGNDKKQGVWKEFFPNGRIKKEMNYENGVLDGLYKEYNQQGKLLVSTRYQEGVIAEEDFSEEENVQIRKEYNEEGILIGSGPYRENTPIGIHRNYDREGNVTDATIYNNEGNVVSRGIVDPEGRKQGSWKDYYPGGTLKAEGRYNNNRRNGNWKFYYENGSLEQTGSYRNGRAEGLWSWYYPSGNLRREEDYYDGREDGRSVEYDEEGNIIAEGSYIDGEKQGKWVYKVGDLTEEGSYIIGLKDGFWKRYYANGELAYLGKYVQGNADGRHKLYWPNGELKEERIYEMGLKEKTWRKYDDQGNLLLTITYKDDREHRINGIKVKLPEREVILIK